MKNSRALLFLLSILALAPQAAHAINCSQVNPRLMNDGDSCTSSFGFTYKLLKRFIIPINAASSYNFEVWREEESGVIWGDLLRTGFSRVPSLAYGAMAYGGQSGFFAKEACETGYVMNSVVKPALGLTGTFRLPTHSEYYYGRFFGVWEVLPYANYWAWESTSSNAISNPGPNWDDNYVYNLATAQENTGGHFQWVGPPPAGYGSQQYARCIMTP